MGSMNAMGHAIAAGAGGDVDELWDLLHDFAQRRDGPEASVGVHSTLGDGPRYCVHVGVSAPGSHVAQDDVLADALRAAAVRLAHAMDPDDVWRRE